MPFDWLAFADASVGSYMYNKVHAGVGYGTDRWGLLIEGVRVGSDGFKELDGGGDTGFARNDLMLKARYSTERKAGVFHEFELKLGYGDENSNETYLGLTDADFAATPYRRYSASRYDRMEWWRTQAQLSYFLDAGIVDVRLTGYRHDLGRDWFKVNRFAGGSPLASILANDTAGQNGVYAAILRGEEDSVSPDQSIGIGNNGRTFVSQGAQLVGHIYVPKLGPVEQTIEFGARYHYDRIRRNHTEDSFNMLNGVPLATGAPQLSLVRNIAATDAVALYAQDEIEVGPVLLTPGARVELIWNSLVNETANTTVSAAYYAVMPGLGAYWQATDWLGVLAGVYKGFSPLSPGQAAGVAPEESWNYEAGARFGHMGFKGELVGFFNDFSNLTGECTFSQGCVLDDINQQFNGGKVFVYGLEAGASHEQPLGGSFVLRFAAAYTLTQSEFRSTFTSANPQFGDVQEGDRLPYVPVHQGSFSTGMGHERFTFDVVVNAVSEMRDVAGQGEIAANERIAGYYVIDAVASVLLIPRLTFYVKGDNVTNNTYAVSRRPFGLRPGTPLQLYAGLRFEL